MSQAARPRPTIGKRIADMQGDIGVNYGLNRTRRTPQSISTPVGSGQSNNSNIGGQASQFLRTAGDSMIGPIAFFPTFVTINASDQIDISPNATGGVSQDSSYVFVSFASPDDLESILGAQFTGQLLYLEIPANQTLVIEDFSNNAGGNIITSDGNDITVTTPVTANPAIVTLLFDSTQSPNGNQGGWVVIGNSQGGGGGGGPFATVALDNLVLPTLNTFINFNSFAPTNFPGFTNLVGQALAVDASGVTWDMPAGDTYTHRIAGADKVEITAVGVGMGTGVNLSMGENFITMDDIATPANPGVGQRRIFVDTGTGKLSVRTQAGATVSLEEGGAASGSFDDNAFDIHDNVDNTKRFIFVADNIQTGTDVSFAATTTAARTITFPDITGELVSTQGVQNIAGSKTFTTTVDFDGNVNLGNATTDTVTMTARFDSNVLPNTNGTRDLGSSTNHWDEVYTEQITLRGVSGPAVSSTKYVTADSDDVLFHTTATDGFRWLQNNAVLMEFENDGTEFYQRAGSGKFIGWLPDDDSVTIGTSGTLVRPVDGGSVGSAAAADTDFGDKVGSMGMYLNTIGVGNPTIVWKIDDGTGTDNRWVTLTIDRTLGTLTGGVLT